MLLWYDYVHKLFIWTRVEVEPKKFISFLVRVMISCLLVVCNAKSLEVGEFLGFFEWLSLLYSRTGLHFLLLKLIFLKKNPHPTCFGLWTGSGPILVGFQGNQPDYTPTSYWVAHSCVWTWDDCDCLSCLIRYWDRRSKILQFWNCLAAKITEHLVR